MRQPFHSGELRHRVVIESPRYYDDGLGETKTDYVSTGEIWAKVTQSSGSEGAFRNRSEHRSTFIFETYYRADLRPTDRLVFDCWRFNIQDLEDVASMKRWLKIVAMKGDDPLDRIDEVNELMIFDYEGLPLKTFSNETMKVFKGDPISSYDNNSNIHVFGTNETVTNFANTEECGV